jgi:deazaflavin-dependent oxidoreductase (nitroreductase family)
MTDFNQRIIAEFRANNGHVTTAGFGDGLVLLHTVGAKSGEPRVNPLAAIPDGDGWLVAASAAGAEKHPAWYFNLSANPDVTVETPQGTVGATAVELEGAEYDTGWAKFTARSSAFADYQERAGDRRIPVVRLEPRPATDN